MLFVLDLICDLNLLTDSLKDSAHWSHLFMNQTTVVILQVCCYVQPERR